MFSNTERNENTVRDDRHLYPQTYQPALHVLVHKWMFKSENKVYGDLATRWLVTFHKSEYYLIIAK